MLEHSSKYFAALPTPLDCNVFQAFNEKLIVLPERWNLVFLDFNHRSFGRHLLKNALINILTLQESMCCALIAKGGECSCPAAFNLQMQFLSVVLGSLVTTLKTMTNKGLDLSQTAQCNTTSNNEDIAKQFNTFFDQEIENKGSIVNNSGGILRLSIKGSVEIGNQTVATYTDDNGIVLEPGMEIKPIKAYYRIGTTHVS